ncbi:DUF7146 domain-containing protein [Rhizobium sullae]|uniref:Toprim domain-containing protein n=1 Tax=Rhizobium sullae TaxID=50338 RepID=A0A4R3QBE1_RHISU|nr:toprim domain-containing protein [Rhizobium sullae]TCU18808.1 Toprim domain-containing protein [Rhizobium sullae]
MNILVAAKLLGGDVVGRNGVICPGPGHSASDRSLSVTFTERGFIVHPHAADDWRVCRDYVKLRLGGTAVAVAASRPEDDRWRTERALAIWNASMPITGTPAAAYLASRGVEYQGAALRWHPLCPFDKGIAGCMVALVRNIVTDEPQAIHRTAIDWTGRKQSHLGSNGRKALGPIKGGAIKLMDAAHGSLAIGEGIETALSVHRLYGWPVWSLLTAGGIKAFPALSQIRSILIAADNDANGTGQNAAQAAAKTCTAAGVKAAIVIPDVVGTDFNDIAAGSHA